MHQLTFLDLAAMLKIDDATTVENFGGRINSSFFEGANLLGSLKLKGYVEFTATVGTNPVGLSEKGKNILLLLEKESEKEIGELEHAVLESIAEGYNKPDKVSSKLNVSEKDVAVNLYRLLKKGYLEHSFRNGKVTVVLTEKGFSSIGEKWREILKKKEAAEKPLPKEEPKEDLKAKPPEEKEKVEAKKPAEKKTRQEILEEAALETEGEEVKELFSADGPVKLDKEKMKESKNAFYVEKYKYIAIGIVLLFIILLLLIVFVR